jgi:hypothetical protein
MSRRHFNMDDYKQIDQWLNEVCQKIRELNIHKTNIEMILSEIHHIQWITLRNMGLKI